MKSNQAPPIIDISSNLLYFPKKKRFCALNLPIYPGRVIFTDNHVPLLVGAGLWPFKNCYKVDLYRCTITKFSSLNIGRYNHSVCILDREIYVIGGYVSLNEEISNVEKFDGRSWVEIQSMHFPRANHTSVSVNNCIYVFGGNNSGCGVEVFDGSTWSALELEFASRMREMGACVSGDSVYIVGGYRFALTKMRSVANAYRFDTQLQSLEVLATLPEPESFENNGVRCGDTLHFIGKRKSYLYNLHSGEWEVNEKNSVCRYCLSPECTSTSSTCKWEKRKASLKLFKTLKVTLL